MQNKTISITAVDSGVVTYRCSVVKEYLKPEWGRYFYSNRNISDNPLYC
jgi:hypothetical protein